jgi:hypothetical protein
MSAPSNTVSIREFARLDGCSDKLVRRAISEGKLTLSADGKLDAGLAKSGWRRTNRRAAEGADIGADTAQMSAPAVRATPRAPQMSAPAVGPDGESLDPAAISDGDFVASVLAGRYFDVATAERVKENGLAAKNLLAARKEAGDVVDLEVAEAVLFEQARHFRDAWLNWPNRVAPLIAAKLDVPVDPVLEALKEHVQQHLASLGEPEGDFANADEG